MTKPDHAARRIGLLATEMATPGGVQSFMQRVAEVISGVVEQDPSVQGYYFEPTLTVKKSAAPAARRTACPRPNEAKAQSRSRMTRRSVSPEDTRCVYSTQVGNSELEGTTLPLHRGQSVPHPSPDSETRRK